jgi:hypothetical protein
VAKYSTKPSDLIGEPRDKDGKLLGWHSEISHKDWFLELTRQIHGTKHVVLAGILRQYMTDEEPNEEEILESMNDENDILNVDSDDLFFFNWWRDCKKYYRKLYDQTSTGEPIENVMELPLKLIEVPLQRMEVLSSQMELPL